MKKIIYTLPIIALLSCESRTYDDISDQTPVAATVNYNTNVKPILDKNCVGCHAKGTQPPPLDNYTDAKKNIDLIIQYIKKPASDAYLMPLGGPPLPATQISTIEKWKTDGLLEK